MVSWRLWNVVQFYRWFLLAYVKLTYLFNNNIKVLSERVSITQSYWCLTYFLEQKSQASISEHFHCLEHPRNKKKYWLIFLCKTWRHKQHHKKVLFSSFHLNSHTLGFHQQTQKQEPPCVQRNKLEHRKALFSSFHLNGHTLGFHLKTQKLESLLSSYHLNGCPSGFHRQTQKLESPVQTNTQHHKEVMQGSFNLNGHNLFRISWTDSKVRITLHSKINSTTGKSCR